MINAFCEIMGFLVLLGIIGLFIEGLISGFKS